jgi:hypothetical protein
VFGKTISCGSVVHIVWYRFINWAVFPIYYCRMCNSD